MLPYFFLLIHGFDCVISWLTMELDLMSLSTMFQSYHDRLSSCHRMAYTHFHNVASLEYHALESRHDTTPDNRSISPFSALQVWVSARRPKPKGRHGTHYIYTMGLGVTHFIYNRSMHYFRPFCVKIPFLYLHFLQTFYTAFFTFCVKYTNYTANKCY